MYITIKAPQPPDVKIHLTGEEAQVFKAALFEATMALDLKDVGLRSDRYTILRDIRFRLTDAGV